MSNWSRLFETSKKVWRKRKIIIITFSLSVLILWSIFGVYLLFYPLGIILKLTDNAPGIYPIPCSNPENIDLEGATLFLSDLHLTFGEDSSRFSGLANSISRNDVRNLVLIGDLFNSPHEAEKILNDLDYGQAVDEIFFRLGISETTVKVFFIKGSQAHDPINFDLNFDQDGVSFSTLGKCSRFSSNETRIITIHGDDAFGGLHGFIISSITGRPYLESWWKDLMELDDEEWVIMGHSHRPDIDYSRRVANTGGWTDFLGFGPLRGRGILLVNNTIELVKISDKIP